MLNDGGANEVNVEFYLSCTGQLGEIDALSAARALPVFRRCMIAKLRASNGSLKFNHLFQRNLQDYIYIPDTVRYILCKSTLCFMQE